MNKLLYSIWWIITTWILVISSEIIYHNTHIISSILLWIIYIVFILWLNYKIPKLLWLITQEWYFDALVDKRSNKAKIITSIIIIIGIVSGIYIYKTNIIPNISETIAQRTSTHIKLNQGEVPCISIGEPCK